jgi:hypothetical protein
VGIEKMLAAIRAYARFLTLQALLEAFSLLTLMDTPNGITRPGVLRYFPGFGLARTNRPPVLHFEFLHSLGR